MAEVFLAKPNIEYEEEFTDMAHEWAMCGDDAPWYMQAHSDFLKMLSRLEGFSRGVGLPDGFVRNSTYWLLRGDRKVLGALNLRHSLNDFFLNFGGQIGYGIRPTERGKGYGKEILRLGLVEAKKLGLERVLVCCFSDNIASARVIEANGGVLEDKRECEGKKIYRYWIDISAL